MFLTRYYSKKSIIRIFYVTHVKLFIVISQFYGREICEHCIHQHTWPCLFKNFGADKVIMLLQWDMFPSFYSFKNKKYERKLHFMTVKDIKQKSLSELKAVPQKAHFRNVLRTVNNSDIVLNPIEITIKGENVCIDEWRDNFSNKQTFHYCFGQILHFRYLLFRHIWYLNSFSNSSNHPSQCELSF